MNPRTYFAQQLLFLYDLALNKKQWTTLKAQTTTGYRTTQSQYKIILYLYHNVIQQLQQKISSSMKGHMEESVSLRASTPAGQSYPLVTLVQKEGVRPPMQVEWGASRAWWSDRVEHGIRGGRGVLLHLLSCANVRTK